MYISFQLFFKRIKIQVRSIQYDGGGRGSGSHSMTSLAATVVTSCSGISALARMSWALLEPCWMLVRMRVVPPAVVMILSEEPVDSIEATTEPPEFMPFLFWWVLMCFARWSLRMKRLEHSGQTNFFSPVRQHRDDAEETRRAVFQNTLLKHNDLKLLLFLAGELKTSHLQNK